MCLRSLGRSSGEDVREVAREKRDVIADFLCARGWWEEKLRYLSVCVGIVL